MRLLTLTENNFNRKGVLGMKKSLAGIIAFLIIISAFSVTAFAADKINAYDGLKSSYYEDKSALYGNEIEIADSYETLGVRAKAKTDELIPIYRTDTDSKEKLEKMFEEISAGKSLESFLVPKNEYFAYAYDDSGKAVGYCILSADKLEVQEVGELNEYTNRAFKMTAKSEKALKKSLDLNSASAKYCIISGFAAGTLVYDENSEFSFLPPTAWTAKALLPQTPFTAFRSLAQYSKTICPKWLRTPSIRTAIPIPARHIMKIPAQAKAILANMLPPRFLAAP